MAKRFVVLFALASGTASAQPIIDEHTVDALIDQAIAQAPNVEKFAWGALRRARRSISVGPTVGLLSTAFVEPRDVDAALTFGIGFERFDVPVLPSLDTMEELVVERLKAQVKERIMDVLSTHRLTIPDLQRLITEYYDDARKEVIRIHNLQPKTIEEPSFSVAIEANRLFAADRWLGRVRGGIGIWKLTLGASVAVGRVCRGDGCDDRIKLFAGPEVVMHVMPSKGVMSPVVDLFLRGDIQTTGRSAMTYDQIGLGARFLVDLI